MSSSDGFNRADRLKRITALSPFSVVDNSRLSLLRQLLEIAGMIRYHDQAAGADGTFDKLLGQLSDVHRDLASKKALVPNGNMEPSQALLFTFMENLQDVTGQFNNRWNDIATWYLNDYLQVKPLPVAGDKVWLSFEKNVPEPVTIEQDFGFVANGNTPDPLVYRLEEELTVHSIHIGQAYSVYFERDKTRVPARYLDYVTAIRVKNLLEPAPIDQPLMFGGQQRMQDSKSVGIKICSPALLLREGKRHVTVMLHSENQEWITELDSAVDKIQKNDWDLSIGSVMTEFERQLEQKKTRYPLEQPVAELKRQLEWKKRLNSENKKWRLALEKAVLTLQKQLENKGWSVELDEALTLLKTQIESKDWTADMDRLMPEIDKNGGRFSLEKAVAEIEALFERKKQLPSGNNERTIALGKALAAFKKQLDHEKKLYSDNKDWSIAIDRTVNALKNQDWSLALKHLLAELKQKGLSSAAAETVAEIEELVERKQSLHSENRQRNSALANALTERKKQLVNKDWSSILDRAVSELTGRDWSLSLEKGVDELGDHLDRHQKRDFNNRDWQVLRKAVTAFKQHLAWKRQLHADDKVWSKALKKAADELKKHLPNRDSKTALDNAVEEFTGKAWSDALGNLVNELKKHGENEEKIRFDLFNNLFYLTVSTPGGWKTVPTFLVTQERATDCLQVQFTLPEEFPSTVPCNEEMHSAVSAFPALRIQLNFDAWLYPYSWMANFLLQRIHIRTAVEGINNVLVYNELGRIDNSKPFVPFGINTEAGTWLAVGNYEMSVKNTQSVNLHIDWNQLPVHPQGLEGYYRAYKNNLTNRSFKIRTRYLADFKWKETPGKSLFNLFRAKIQDGQDHPLPAVPLVSESVFNGIVVKKMSTVTHPEETYDYTIKSRTGFVRLTLEEPEGGFGEQRYRQLFTERMMMKKWRKKRLPPLNPPISPVIEKITMDYVAEDLIDLRTTRPEDGTEVYQLYPLGRVSSYSNDEKQAIPFVFSLDTDASILFGLTNVRGGETFSIFLDFRTISNEFSPEDQPQIMLYWREGHKWQPLPEGFIAQDETRQMLVSGMMVLQFPEIIPRSMYDSSGLLWLRAGILKSPECIPALNGIYANAGKVVLKIQDPDDPKWNTFKTVNGELEPEKKLPGIAGFRQITRFYAGQEREDRQQLQVRVSEYITHRGRAVTPRDYERLTLQAFPDVGKVKCLPDYNVKSSKRGVVTLVVVPRPEQYEDYEKPVVPSGLMTLIEEYFSKRTTTSATVDVINPVYEELMVKCCIRLKKDAHTPLMGVRLKEMFDQLIAPWQKPRQLPKFGQPVSLSRMYEQLRKSEFVEAIDYFIVVRVTERKQSNGMPESYTLHPYEPGKGEELIAPDAPHIVFVPADEHIIHFEQHDDEPDNFFGIRDMEVGKTFII